MVTTLHVRAAMENQIQGGLSGAGALCHHDVATLTMKLRYCICAICLLISSILAAATDTHDRPKTL